jgi:hypothetical protein
LKIEERTALVLGTVLFVALLCAGVIQIFVRDVSFFQAIQGGVTLVVSILTLFALLFTAWTNQKQRILMQGQLEAAQTANAASSALDRPLLAVEIRSINENGWLSENRTLVAKLRITNVGKGPAFIKSFKVVHFRGPDHQNGRPPVDLPPDVLDVPEPAELAKFIHYRGVMPKFVVNVNYMRPQIISSETLRDATPDFVIGGNETSDEFSVEGYRKLERAAEEGIQPMRYTESYILGSIFYEIPGQAAEILTFCYHKPAGQNVRRFRDWPPYNERKKA